MARGHLWSIVLAGGDGVRTSAFIRRWLGSAKPKQCMIQDLSLSDVVGGMVDQ